MGASVNNFWLKDSKNTTPDRILKTDVGEHRKKSIFLSLIQVPCPDAPNSEVEEVYSIPTLGSTQPNIHTTYNNSYNTYVYPTGKLDFFRFLLYISGEMLHNEMKSCQMQNVWSTEEFNVQGLLVILLLRLHTLDMATTQPTIHLHYHSKTFIQLLKVGRLVQRIFLVDCTSTSVEG